MRKEIIELLSRVTEEEKSYLNGATLDFDRYISDDLQVINSDKLLLEEELIQIRPHVRFIDFPLHRHDFVEMTYVIRGTMTHVIDGKELVMEEGDLLLLNQNVSQSIKRTSKDDLAINFIIKPIFFDKVFLMIEEQNFIWDFIISCVRLNRYETKYLFFKTKDIIPLENLLENMIFSILHQKGKSNGVIQTTLGLLLLQLSEHAEIIEFGESGFDNRLLLAVYKYIEEQYKDAELSLLARSLGIRTYWLSREIKSISGKTFKELLMEKRLAQAAFLLRKTELSTVEIINHVGYQNTSYFHRIFKDKYGLTPKQYRSRVSF